MNNEDEMSNTFVDEVGQKSAIFNKDDSNIETLDTEENDGNEMFPEVKIDPPTGESEILEETKKEETLEMDDEFVEKKDKKKANNNKKKHPFLTFLLMIICIALGAGASYYYFEVYNVKEEPKQVEDKKEEVKDTIEQLQPTSRFVKKLIDRYSIDYSDSLLESYAELYAKDKTTVADLSKDYTQKLAILNMDSKASFSDEEFQDSLDQLFGKDIVKNEKKDIVISSCYKFEYKDGSYVLGKSPDVCGTTAVYSVKKKIVKAENNLESKNITINVAVALTDGNKVYKSYDDEAKTGKEEIVDLTAEGLNMDVDYAKFNQYKYTFKYDNDNNDYYLDSIELDK